METMVNKVQLIGYLGRDPEVLTFENGKKKLSVSIATPDVYTNQNGERIDGTDWHNLVAWNKTAELGEKLLKKGSHVAIEGRLKSRSYEDKDGVKRYVTEVMVDQFLLLDKKEAATAK